jgi:phosphoribosylformylglycinamidine synthase
MAARAAIMPAVAHHAGSGRALLGVCNGFQILCEAGLLPGVVMRNIGQRFVCRETRLAIANPDTIFTRAFKTTETVIPVAHGDGRYIADEDTLNRLEGDGRVALRYLDNPNGAARDIAGLLNARGNVLGMMPHPERVCDPALGRTGGWAIFASLAEALQAAA